MPIGLPEFADNREKRCPVVLLIDTFGGDVRTVQDFVGIQAFQPPTLTTSGNTPMGQALEVAMDLVEARKCNYKEGEVHYFRPWIFLITDGAPTDSWQMAAKRLREEEANNRFLFFAVGVEGADFSTLSQIAPSNRPPAHLKGLDFREMFMWLSSSMKRVSNSKSGEMLSLPSIDGWTQINPG
jgi:uncharacterized protein YegL